MAKAVSGWMTEYGEFYEVEADAVASEGALRWPKVIGKLEWGVKALGSAPDEESKRAVVEELVKFLGKV